MTFNVGDKIKLLNEVGEGHVTSILNKLLIEVEIDGFTYKVNRKDIILTEQFTVSDLPEDIYAIKESQESKTIKQSKKSKRSPDAEVDLHLHNLTSSETGLSNSEKLYIQISAFREKLEECIKKKTPSLIVVHGIGKGVLKAEVRRILMEEYELEFFDAPMNKFGWGATQIKIV